jgi:Arc/MetJ-type ribon-helix-helix transcriptional regulator
VVVFAVAIEVTGAVCVTFCSMPTLTIRTDPEVEAALDALTRGGRSRSEAARAAILDAERAQRRAALRAEAEALRDDPDDVQASRELAAEMDTIRAW